MDGFFFHFVDLSWLIKFVQSREKVSRLEFSSAKRKRKMHIVAWKIYFQIRAILYSFNEEENLINCPFLRTTHLFLTRNYYPWSTWSGKPRTWSIHYAFCSNSTGIWNLISILLLERGFCRSLPDFLFHQLCPCPCFPRINSSETYIYTDSSLLVSRVHERSLSPFLPLSRTTIILKLSHQTIRPVISTLHSNLHSLYLILSQSSALSLTRS